MGNYDTNLVERLLTELSRKEISTLESMSWGELSTHFSKKGFEAAKSSGLALEEAGSLIHDYWVNAVKAVVTLMHNGYTIEGYTWDKLASHVPLLVKYDELSREEQVKDLYMIYEFDPVWFMAQEGSSDLVELFPSVIHWVDWS